MERRELVNRFERDWKILIPEYRHYLLAASGANPGATRRDLNALESQPFTTNAPPTVPGWDPDTNKYLAQLQQQSKLQMINESVERAHRNFDAFVQENADINWELQRKKIYEHFGLLSKRGDQLGDDENAMLNPGGKGSFGKFSRKGRTANPGAGGQTTMNRSILGNSSLQKSVIGTPGTGASNATIFADVADKNGGPSNPLDDRSLRDKQAKFAQKVRALNEARLRESPFPILQEFLTVENQPGQEVSLLRDTWCSCLIFRCRIQSISSTLTARSLRLLMSLHPSLANRTKREKESSPKTISMKIQIPQDHVACVKESLMALSALWRNSKVPLFWNPLRQCLVVIGSSIISRLL